MRMNLPSAMKKAGLVAMLAAMSGCTHIEETALTDQLPDLPGATALSREADFASERTALSAWLDNYLKHEYRIVGGRFFVDDPQTKWVVVDAFARNHIEQTLAGVREYKDWHEPGYDLVSLWRVGDEGRAIAVAMSGDDLPDGRRLIGYFDLQKQ
jgi:hypothetical protein